MANKTNLPAVTGGQSFNLSTTSAAVPMNPALLEHVDETDFKGYTAAREALPIVSIRGKELKNEKGKIVCEAGNFKIYDSVTADDGDMQIPDIPGPLMYSILADQPSRVYWPKGEFGRPHCRSSDGIVGLGVGSGDCATCPLGQFKAKGERPDCTSQINVLVYDHALQGCVVFRVGRGGLKAYTKFMAKLERQGRVDSQTTYPGYSFLVEVTPFYESEAEVPYFRPAFRMLGQIEVDLFCKLKTLRQEMNETLQRTSAVDTEDEEHPARDIPTGDPGGEVPPDATSVKTDSDNGDLPF